MARSDDASETFHETVSSTAYSGDEEKRKYSCTMQVRSWWLAVIAASSPQYQDLPQAGELMLLEALGVQ